MLRPMKVGDETCIIHHINKVGKKKEKKERRREVCRRFRFWCLVGRVAERGQMSGKEKKKRVVTALALVHSLDISPASYIQIELVLMCEQQKIPAAASWVGVNHAR